MRFGNVSSLEFAPHHFYIMLRTWGFDFQKILKIGDFVLILLKNITKKQFLSSKNGRTQLIFKLFEKRYPSS